MTTLALNRFYSPVLPTRNTGSSQEALGIQKQIEELVCQYRSTAATRQPAFIELARLRFAGCRGETHEEAISKDAYNIGIRFLCALPTTLPSPEVSVDPDGEISFEWLHDRDRMLSVSANPNGRLSFAASIRPGISNHGTELFDDRIPQQLISLLERMGPA